MAAPPTVPEQMAPSALPLNLNPFTSPSHPAHVKGARHFGAAIAHLLLGNGEAAADHLGAAIGHAVAPHVADAAGATATASMRKAAHGSGKEK